MASTSWGHGLPAVQQILFRKSQDVGERRSLFLVRKLLQITKVDVFMTELHVVRSTRSGFQAVVPAQSHVAGGNALKRGESRIGQLLHGGTSLDGAAAYCLASFLANSVISFGT